MENPDEIVEIELYAKEGKEVPEARTYRIRVDRKTYDVHSPIVQGKEILKLAAKTPDTHKLYQHQRGQQPKQIGPEDKVNLREPGVERFTTMPRDTTEGLVSNQARRQFQLPSDDTAYLNGLGLEWETILWDNVRWLLIHRWQVPDGYNHHEISVALEIPANYSDSQIDMVYFNPPLARLDSKPIGALAARDIDGVQYQRWSRHRSGTNPWVPGVDDVASHLCLVDEWLNREFGA